MPTTESRRIWTRVVGLGLAVSLAGCVEPLDDGATDEADRDEAGADVLQLPIEVLGRGGRTRTVTLHVPPGRAASARGLELQINNLSYDGKADVRINEGSWISVRSSTVDVYEPELSYGGIGGGFGTLRLSVPLDAGDIGGGANRIDLRYRATKPDGTKDEDSIGYRVIALNVIDGQGEPLVPAHRYRDVDPAGWGPPAIDGAPATAADIAAGEDLWYGATLRASWHGARQLEAKCADCHAEDGFDLAYFNYSNESIAKRAQFHGLSPAQGNQIAAYIRSLDVPRAPNARPWNPPYQPGPGTDAKPVAHWAAGAGLDAVLDSDAQMKPFLFGDGSQAAIDARTNVDGQLNIREIPIAVQFPDWKHWLPRVHPVDIWGRAAFENGGAFTTYESLRERLHGPPLTGNPLRERFDEFPEAVTRFLRPNAAHPQSGATWAQNGAALSPRQNTAVQRGFTPEMTKFHLASWAAVKQFELVERHGLADTMVGPAAEARQYPTRRYSVFHLAPHYIGDQRGTSAFIGQDLTTGAYWSSIWYQLQLTLNPGQKTVDAIEPVDWAYNYGHVLKLGRRSGIAEPYRYFQNLIKGYQARNQGSTTSTAIWGWNMREVSPWRIYSDYAGETTIHAAMGASMRRKVTNSMLKQFLTQAERFSVGDWTRRNPAANLAPFQVWSVLETAGYQPRLDPGNNPTMPQGFQHQNLFAFNGASDAVEADAFARLMPRLEALGVGCAIRQRLGAWAAQFWPRHDWTVTCGG